MKHKVFLIAALLMALVAPQVAKAQFSYTYQGKTLYYSIIDYSNHRVSVFNLNPGVNYISGGVVIPDSVESDNIKYAVTSIGEYAFGSCEQLTSVTIPNSVTFIGKSAFSDCRRLTSIYIPDSVSQIGAHAFFCCSSLTSITIPNSVTTIVT